MCWLIGSSALVKAFKDAGAPADSTWSSSGGVSVDCSEGTSTKATGVEASQSAWAANVHSVSKDYPTLSDDEPFTVVKVVSITAEPAVVCVGNSNIAYAITTQPGGFEHMVQYTPADVSTLGVKEVVATCGVSAATCTVTVVGVELSMAEYLGIDLTEPADDFDTATASVTVTLAEQVTNYVGV